MLNTPTQGIAPDRTEFEDVQARLRSMKDVGVRWLLDRIESSGRPIAAEQHHGYYRLPWVLAYTGERAAAGQVLSWMESHTLTSDGDLREGVARDAWVTSASTYPLSIISVGASLLERHDVARACMSTLRSFISSDGGARMARPEVGSDVQIGFLTAQLGVTAIATGQFDIAHGCYGWFEQLMAEQLELPGRLFLAREGGRLYTDWGDAPSYNYVVDFSQPRQAFHTPGIAAYFLGRYSMSTGLARPAELGMRILRLHDPATEEQFNHLESSAICKLGLGAATMLDATGDPALLPTISRMTTWYEDARLEDGSWMHRTVNRPNPTEAHILEKTAEHVLWVAMMEASVSAWLGRTEDSIEHGRDQ